MNSVGVVRTLFASALERHGKIDRETQDRALAVLGADGVVKPAELAAVDRLLAAHADRFEDAPRWRERLAVLSAPAEGARRSPLDARVLNAARPAFDDGRLVLSELDGRWASPVAQRFALPAGVRDVQDGHAVLIPLAARELHVIELQYQDTRKLRDLEFNYSEAGSYESKTFRGDQWFEMEAREKRGEVTIRRERDHDAPWLNNPVKVKVEVLYPDGRVHHVGNKFLDFHVHDAHSPDSSGYPETDNISNGYERLPAGALPEGCFLRLTPFFAAKKPWESERTVAANLAWVQPSYLPAHAERKTVFAGADFERPPALGYDVDPDRPIAAVMVNWTDRGGTASGSVALGDGWQSPRSNVGSGETELIPLEGRKAPGGKLRIEGYGVEVRRVEVLYGE